MTLARPRLVLTFFRNRMFKGNLSQSIDFTIRDYETCAEQLELDERQKVKYFVNFLEDSPAYISSTPSIRRTWTSRLCVLGCAKSTIAAVASCR